MRGFALAARNCLKTAAVDFGEIRHGDNPQADYCGADGVELERADLDAELEQEQPDDDRHAADQVHEEPARQPHKNV